MQATLPTLLAAALRYTQRWGWSVFPCRGKVPLTPNGFKDASRDPRQLRRWWTLWPDANIGVPTGNGLVVLDVDPRHNGDKSLKALVGEHEPLFPTRKCLSGGEDRGWHLYFATEQLVRSSASAVAPGLDLRGEGAYVIVPPSIHPDTDRAYTWEDDDAPISPLPEWLYEATQRVRRARPELDEIAHGRRNSTLTSFGGTMRRRGAGAQAILAALRAENAQLTLPLDDEELQRITEHLCRYKPELTSGETRTELGNAYRLVALYGDQIRYNRDQRSWLWWTGQRWLAEGEAESEVERLAEMAAQAIMDEARETKDLAERAELAKWSIKSQSAGTIRGTLWCAHPMLEIGVRTVELDANPWLLNVQNGTLNLEHGAPQLFSPHRREDFQTKLAPVVYDPRAEAPRFLRFLDEIFRGDLAMIRHVQRLFGYCLTGNVDLHHLWVCWGGGRNGKDTLLSQLVGLLGTDYAIEISTKVVVQSNWNDEQERARFRGMRLALASETPEAARLNVDAVKVLTGGNRLRGKIVYRQPFDFQATHKLIIQTNNKPVVTESTEAIWDRLLLVPFTQHYPPGVADTTLKDQLYAERSGVLNWAVAGCLELQVLGMDLGYPEEVVRATASYRAREDVLGAFVAEECELQTARRGPQLSETCKSVWNRYQQWCILNRVKGLGRNLFFEALVKWGNGRISQEPGHANRPTFYGLALRREAASAEELELDLER